MYTIKTFYLYEDHMHYIGQDCSGEMELSAFDFLQTVLVAKWTLIESDSAIFHVAQQQCERTAIEVQMQDRTGKNPTFHASSRIKTHFQGSTDFHHIVLFYYCNSEVVGLHEFLQESTVGFILTP